MAKRKRRQQEEDELTLYFLKVLEKKRIPLLTLDARWHDLFPDFRKTGAIRALERKLNKLIQEQGKTTNDLKDYEKARKALMANIVVNMTDGHEADSLMRSRKQDRNQRLLAELKEKEDAAKRRAQELPTEIEEANRELLVECMYVCYQELMDNTYEIEKIEAWIQDARETLKNEILKKQDMEMRNTRMYRYMHDLLGADVVEIFDRKHKVWKGNIEENKIE